MAVYTSQLLQGTIIWQNYNGTVLQTKTYLANEGEPSYSGSTPSRSDYIPSSGTGTRYTFSGWTLISSSGLDKTYRASFSSRTLYIWDRYNCTWKEEEITDNVLITHHENVGIVSGYTRYTFDKATGTFSTAGDYGVYTWGQNMTGLYHSPSAANHCIYQLTRASGTGNDRFNAQCWRIEAGPAHKSSRNGYVTSTSSSAYPDDGVSGSYWYTKR